MGYARRSGHRDGLDDDTDAGGPWVFLHPGILGPDQQRAADSAGAARADPDSSERDRRTADQSAVGVDHRDARRSHHRSGEPTDHRSSPDRHSAHRSGAHRQLSERDGAYVPGAAGRILLVPGKPASARQRNGHLHRGRAAAHHRGSFLAAGAAKADHLSAAIAVNCRVRHGNPTGHLHGVALRQTGSRDRRGPATGRTGGAADAAGAAGTPGRRQRGPG